MSRMFRLLLVIWLSMAGGAFRVAKITLRTNLFVSSSSSSTVPAC